MEKYYKLLILVICIIFFIFFSIYPEALGKDLSGSRHGLLSLFFLGICFCFIYGVGFKPNFILWRILFGPIFPVILMFGSLILLFL